MKLSNCVVGQRVELKDVNARAIGDVSYSCRHYELTENHQGTIIDTPDSDGDVRVEFDDHINPNTGYAYMYITHTNLRKIQE